MPKIGKDHVTIHGKQVELEVHYSRKTKFHYKGLPEEIYHMTSLGIETYDTETALKQALRSALEIYHEKIKRTRKMIFYTLECSRELVFQTGRNLRSQYDSPGQSKPEIPPGSFFPIRRRIRFSATARNIRRKDRILPAQRGRHSRLPHAPYQEYGCHPYRMDSRTRTILP